MFSLVNPLQKSVSCVPPPLYAHIEVVATLVVVNFFGFLVIARYPTVRLSRKLVEKLRTGLPDLPKPLRNNSFNVNSFETKIEQFNDY